jgi:hypothetical protein
MVRLDGLIAPFIPALDTFSGRVLEYDEDELELVRARSNKRLLKTVKWKLDNRNCLVNKAYNKALVINPRPHFKTGIASHGNEFRFCQPI